jgi:CubicO group peptidase (beta-lactamase class C family)
MKLWGICRFVFLMNCFFGSDVYTQELITYPAPQAVIYSMHNDDYTVRVRKPGSEWQDLYEYNVKVDMDKPQDASMVYFDFSGSVEVYVRKNNSTIKEVRIRPATTSVQPVIKGNMVYFTLTKPGKLSVEFDGDKLHNLHVFANTIETYKPDTNDSNVIYFGPGLHETKEKPGSELLIPSGKTVYIAGGAVVRRKLVCNKVNNVSITGRGIIDQPQRGVEIKHSNNVEVNGIIFINPQHYTIYGGGSQKISIKNIKSFSVKGWSDGIDLMSCSDVTIDDIFMRNSDDCIAIYGHRWDFYGNARNYTITNAILWADVAHPINIGLHGNTEHAGDTIENILFDNIDILEQDEDDTDYEGCMALSVGDLNLVRNIRFENIRVDDFEEGKLFSLRIFYNRKYNTGPGRAIQDIHFKNISYNGANLSPSIIQGYDEAHAINNITFENIRINGKLIRDAADGNIKIGPFAEKVIFMQPAYDFSHIEQKIQTWIDSGYYPGASIIISKDNKVIYKKYFGNYDPRTVVFIASAGKWLAAAVIAAVVDEGKLNWNDKVKKWLPEFTDSKGEANLAQLLSHTAGYPDYQPKGKPIDIYQSLKESVAHILPLTADTFPGTKFRYGGLSMQVAGRIAELATGKSWEALFREKIALPLGMSSTQFTPVDSSGGHAPMLGGGARTTLDDYARFLSMIANDGVYNGKRILSIKAIKAMQADQVANAKVNAGEFVERARASQRKDIYGLGEWREEVNARGEVTLISSPSWAGAYPWIDKKNNVYGFFLAHIAEPKNGFSSFYASPVLAVLVGNVVQRSKHN